jgi:hypothetical protein
MRKEERAKARKRLQGGTTDLKHVCKPNHLKMAFGKDERVELQLRQPNEAKSMQDEEGSAH